MSLVQCEVRQDYSSEYDDCERVHVNFHIHEINLEAIQNAFPFEGKFQFRIQIKGESIGLDNDYLWLDFTPNNFTVINSLVRVGDPLLMQAVDLQSTNNDFVDAEAFYNQYIDAVSASLPPCSLRPLRQPVEGQSCQSDSAGYALFDKLKQPQAISLKAVKKGASNVWKGALNTFKATASQLQSTIHHLKQSSHFLSDESEENLSQLSDALSSKYSDNNSKHAELLRQVWFGLFPNEKNYQRQSSKWKEAGFINTDPILDLKTTGILALQALKYFAETYSSQCQTMLINNRENTKSKYPFGIVAINITMLLAEVLNLRDQKYLSARANYWDLFETANTFFEIFCFIFFAIDSSWTSTNAVRADFGRIIGEAKSNLSKILALGPRNFQEFTSIAKEMQIDR